MLRFVTTAMLVSWVTVLYAGVSWAGWETFGPNLDVEGVQDLVNEIEARQKSLTSDPVLASREREWVRNNLDNVKISLQDLDESQDSGRRAKERFDGMENAAKAVLALNCETYDSADASVVLGKFKNVLGDKLWRGGGLSERVFLR